MELWVGTNISVEYRASIFKVEDGPDDGRSMFLTNVGNYLNVHKTLYPEELHGHWCNAEALYEESLDSGSV